MRVVEDIIAAIFNFKYIGKVLSKRPTGLVAGSFLILVLVYVIVFGMWYTSISGDFIDIALDVAKPALPAFDIIGGRLTMRSSEPYIITHEEVYGMLYNAVIRLDEKHFMGRYAEKIRKDFNKELIRPDRSFCLIMDTTGGYKNKIDLNNYSSYTVVTKDSIEAVDRVSNKPGNTIPISQRIKQDIRFSQETAETLKAPFKRFASTTIMIILAIHTVIRFLLKALIAAFIVWLILLIAKKGKPYDPLYKISLYALSPVILLAVIDRFLLMVNIHGLIYQALYFACIFIATSAIEQTS